jgi:hypothetical protein
VVAHNVFPNAIVWVGSVAAKLRPVTVREEPPVAGLLYSEPEITGESNEKLAAAVPTSELTVTKVLIWPYAVMLLHARAVDVTHETVEQGEEPISAVTV